MINIKIKKLIPQAHLPQKMSEHAAGYDLYSANPKELIIPAGQVKLVSTGIAISLPPGYEAQIRPRSGLALESEIGILNSPGTIDADYRGEIKIILFNFGKTDFKLSPSTRIAQMVIAKYEVVKWQQTEHLDATARGSGGFGHTSL
ncbi:MAG: dUTP pyrophosphatase [Candidatus Cloacimonadota bacterium]|jgi:dUTP pyrophosphatase|nr:dUTP pyrophosphatase [Candidatus Cloacimonadota bacterium]